MSVGQLSEFMRCADPVFSVLRKLVVADDVSQLEGALAAQVRKAFSEFYSALCEIDLSEEDVGLLGYAMAALLDEKMLLADWPGQSEWQRHPLQLQYFAEHVAGEGFFERFEQLRKIYPDKSDVYLFYVYCLMFGFKGKYLGAAGNELEALIADAIDRVTEEHYEPPYVVWSNNAEEQARKNLCRQVGVMVVIGMLVIYLGFLGMTFL